MLVVCGFTAVAGPVFETNATNVAKLLAGGFPAAVPVSAPRLQGLLQ